MRYRKKKRQISSVSYGKYRVWILLIGVFVVVFIIAVRLWSLQISNGETYRSQADDRYTISAELLPNRGKILMQSRNGTYPVAINKQFALVYIVPRDINSENHEEVLSLLRNVLGNENIDEGKIREKMNKQGDPFEIIAHRIERNIAKKINDADIDGVHTKSEIYRHYPADSLAGQTIGFVGSDGKKYRGRYGVERSMDKILSGKSGNLSQLRGAGGRWIALKDKEQIDATHGADVILTMDYSVQFEIEKILKETVEKHDADSGSIVVMRPNGAIVAMASEPHFDPNYYSKVEDISVFINPIVSHAYESGSVLKPITMAIGINDEKVTPESTYVDTGVVHEAGYAIQNSEEKVYGLQTMTQVLEESINTGVIHVERLVGHTNFTKYMEQFGFGKKTGVRLPSEALGNMKNIYPPIRPIQFYTASFGQGITMTPLQLAQSYAIIANDGMLIRPHVIDTIIQNEKEEKQEYQELYRVLHAETAKSVRGMLESVVVNGHGKRAAVPGYRVGGKTGTAQVAGKTKRGYDDNITIGTFAGIAPIGNPEFIVVAKIDNPKGVQWAESTAAPAFQKTMKFLLEYYAILPTEIVEVEKEELQEAVVNAIDNDVINE